MKRVLLLLIGLFVAASLDAVVQFQKVEYKEGDTVCEGLLVYDDMFQGKRPGVLVAHQWKGLTDYEKMRGEMLAKEGYVVLCSDVYGKGVRADNPKDASALAAKYKENRKVLRARINAALDFLRKQERVNPQLIGSCPRMKWSPSKRKCVMRRWIGNWSLTAARSIPSRTKAPATTIRKARPTTKRPISVPGAR